MLSSSVETNGKYILYKHRINPKRWGVYGWKAADEDGSKGISSKTKKYMKKWIVKNKSEKVARAKYNQKCRCESFTIKTGEKNPKYCTANDRVKAGEYRD